MIPHSKPVCPSCSVCLMCVNEGKAEHTEACEIKPKKMEGA